MASTNPARGMRDFLPADVRKRNYVIGIIKEVYESYTSNRSKPRPSKTSKP